jgi:hypothetical protein
MNIRNIHSPISNRCAMSHILFISMNTKDKIPINACLPNVNRAFFWCANALIWH